MKHVAYLIMMKALESDPLNIRVHGAALIFASLLPFIGVAATQVPFKQILAAVKGLLL